MNAARFVAAISAWSVSLSPDGQRLAYVSDRDGVPQLFVCELDGGEETRVDTGEHPVQEAHWSVAGAWISVLLAPGGSPRTEVWTVRPDGRDLHRLPGLDEGASCLGPWTHRPGVLAYSRTTEPTAGLAVLHDVATGLETPIASGGQPLVLDVDREGLLALVRRGPRGQRTVWLIDLGTGKERELSPHENRGSTDLGRLSPDGNIAYLRSNAGRDLFALFEVSLTPDASHPSPRDRRAPRRRTRRSDPDRRWRHRRAALESGGAHGVRTDRP